MTLNEILKLIQQGKLDSFHVGFKNGRYWIIAHIGHHQVEGELSHDDVEDVKGLQHFMEYFMIKLEPYAPIGAPRDGR